MFCILFLFNLLLIVYHKYTISCSVKVFGHSQLCNYNFYSKLIAFKVIRDISIINHYFKKFCFRYVDAYLGIVKDTKQVVTIEEFATGSFQKYVNRSMMVLFVQAKMMTCKRRQRVWSTSLTSNPTKN